MNICSPEWHPRCEISLIGGIGGLLRNDLIWLRSFGWVGEEMLRGWAGGSTCDVDNRGCVNTNSPHL